MLYFEEMNFYRHEFFKIVPDSFFRVTFISGSENHKSHDNFFSYFPFPSSFFMASRGVGFLKFSENYNKTAWWCLYFVTPQVSWAEVFFGGIFWNYQNKYSVEQMWMTASEVFSFNFSKFFKPSFLGFIKSTDKPTTYHRPPTNRPPTKKKFEDQKFYNKFKMDNW